MKFYQVGLLAAINEVIDISCNYKAYYLLLSLNSELRLKITPCMLHINSNSKFWGVGT